jgi:hypothetical protein
MNNKKLQKSLQTSVNSDNSILGGKPNFKDAPGYTKVLAIKTHKEENIHVKNPISGKETDIVLSRDGSTDQKLAMVLLSPDATKDQKDSWVANYLFERGKENAAYFADLMVSKGTHVKETQAFKRQIRFDFESFANSMVIMFHDMADDIAKFTNEHEQEQKGKTSKLYTPFQNAIIQMGKRFESAAELLTSQREKITNDRMREKGYGVYLDKSGRAFSIFDDEIEDAVKKDKQDYKDDLEDSANRY